MEIVELIQPGNEVPVEIRRKAVEVLDTLVSPKEGREGLASIGEMKLRSYSSQFRPISNLVVASLRLGSPPR